ncbi:hypothetical protein [Vibrio alginolyticus]|uniref:hypothetical protein n=1 Tax=Vibrio alginolyticus TaxID=663 RepID=UPI001F0E35D4|nr:hypothetical protein [Vibrio alginolyticus]
MMINLYEEAVWVRRKIESVVGKGWFYFGSDFPINACKHASMLFCYHLIQKGYSKPIFLVFGVSKKRGGEVGHWWVESDGTLVDITADQFNIIEDSELSYKIKSNRLYLPVYCVPTVNAPHHKVFEPVPKELWAWNEGDVCEIYLDELSTCYSRLLQQFT